jgi:hypothetical protein
MRGVGAQIDLVMLLCDRQRLRQLARSGAQPPNVLHPAPFPHKGKAAPRLDRANQNQAVSRPTFDEHIQHPVHAVVEIDIGGTRFIPLDKRTRAWPREGVARFVTVDEIRFDLDDFASTLSPNELGTDQIPGANKRVNLKERVGQHPCKIAVLL